jgi:hypothetical protein
MAAVTNGKLSFQWPQSLAITFSTITAAVRDKLSIQWSVYGGKTFLYNGCGNWW